MHRYAAFALLVVAGCSGGKGVANRALESADQAVAALPADAVKIAPEELAPILDAVHTAKEQRDKGDYEMAIATVKLR